MKINKLDLKKEFAWNDADTKHLDLWDIVHEYEGNHCNFDQKMLIRIIERMEEKINELSEALNNLNKK